MDADRIHDIIEQCEIDALGLLRPDAMLTLDIYHAFIENDLPTGLQYLIRGAEHRRSFEALLPNTQSVLCAAFLLPPAFEGWARFCAIGDYHEIVRARLTRLEQSLRKEKLIHGHTRICVDSAPILERELGVRAGLGWISSNHQLVHPMLGAGIVLGELLLTDNLDPYASAFQWHTIPFDPRALIPGSHCLCHNQRLCEQNCPTHALEHHTYHVNRCLAYLTTQHTGVLEDDHALAMGNCVWGCDRCQTHCPVAKYAQTTEMNMPYAMLSPECVLTASAKKLTRLLAGSPMQAAHPRILQRNYCYVLGNQNDTTYADLLKYVAQNNPCEWVQAAACRSLRMILKPL